MNARLNRIALVLMGLLLAFPNQAAFAANVQLESLGFAAQSSFDFGRAESYYAEKLEGLQAGTAAAIVSSSEATNVPFGTPYVGPYLGHSSALQDQGGYSSLQSDCENSGNAFVVNEIAKAYASWSIKIWN